MTYLIKNVCHVKLLTFILWYNIWFIQGQALDTSKHIKNCVPEQVHITYGDNIGNMVVMWSTHDDCSTMIRYDTTPWNFQHQATGSNVKLEETNKSNSKYMHRVILQNLDADKTYYYRPISSGVSIGPFYFRTKPIAKVWTPKFLVHSEINEEIISSINNEVLTKDITAVFSTQNYYFDSNNNPQNNMLMKMLESLTTKIPYLLTPSDQVEESELSYSQYRHEFSMPNSEWPIPVTKLWYSIDIGPVHFISYSTEVFFTKIKNQRQIQRDWLIADLKEANIKRSERPWIIALGHRPMYCSNHTDSDCSNTDSTVRAGFEDIFYNHGVDIVLQANEPVYERLYPVYKEVILSDNYTNPMAPIQIILGNNDNNISFSTDNDNNQTKEWSAFQQPSKISSFGSLQILNKTHLKYEQTYTNSTIFDSFWIVQENHGPFHREKLPEKVEEKIEETIKKNGEKPVYVDKNIDKEKNGDDEYKKDQLQRMYIGIGFGCLFAVIIIVFIGVKSCKRRQRSSRRWESLDFNYSKKFYSTPKANGSKALDDNDTDFEIDMTDGTTKLLNDD